MLKLKQILTRPAKTHTFEFFRIRDKFKVQMDEYNFADSNDGYKLNN